MLFVDSFAQVSALANGKRSFAATPYQPYGPTPLGGRGGASLLSDVMQLRVPSWTRNREPGLPFLTEPLTPLLRPSARAPSPEKSDQTGSHSPLPRPQQPSAASDG